MCKTVFESSFATIVMLQMLACKICTPNYCTIFDHFVCASEKIMSLRRPHCILHFESPHKHKNNSFRQGVYSISDDLGLDFLK